MDTEHGNDQETTSLITVFIFYVTHFHVASYKAIKEKKNPDAILFIKYNYTSKANIIYRISIHFFLIIETSQGV